MATLKEVEKVCRKNPNSLLRFIHAETAETLLFVWGDGSNSLKAGGIPDRMGFSKQKIGQTIVKGFYTISPIDSVATPVNRNAMRGADYQRIRGK